MELYKITNEQFRTVSPPALARTAGGSQLGEGAALLDHHSRLIVDHLDDLAVLEELKAQWAGG